MNKVPFPVGRYRLGCRWSHYLHWSTSNKHFEGMIDALFGLMNLGVLTLLDFLFKGQRVTCNICGWHGWSFYPNVGPGYFEYSVCPGCGCIHRYRSLAAILEVKTTFFSSDTSVIEVAPIPGFQSYCLWRKNGIGYLSFDLGPFAMEKGDVTLMRNEDSSCDYFLCFHVLEHVMEDVLAVREIFRVLRPGGQAVLQVPIDFSLHETVEYGKPNIFETGHVRRYSETGFANRLESEGFLVSKFNVSDFFSEKEIQRYGFDREQIYFATKPIS